MEKAIVLPVGTLKISVSDAISKILESGAFSPTVEIYLEILTDDTGDEYYKPNGKVTASQGDGKKLAAESIKPSFLSYCEATATKPTSPYAPWIFDYDGANQYHDVLYQITVDEMRRFALNYGINVLVAESPPANDSHLMPLSKAVAAGSTLSRNSKKKATGRPKTVHRKAAIVGKLIAVMTVGERLTANALPGSIADLLDACARVEIAITKKTTNFGGATTETFNRWLKQAGYGMKSGRTRGAEEKYWTNLLPKVMSKIPCNVFV